MSRYTGWDIEQVRRKRSADDAEALAAVPPKRSKSEASFPATNGFTAVNESTGNVAAAPIAPSTTYQDDFPKGGITVQVSPTRGRKTHPVAQYLEAYPCLLPPPVKKRNARPASKKGNYAGSGNIAAHSVTGSAHVTQSVPDQALMAPQMKTPQNSAKKRPRPPQTKSKRTISAGMRVTKPGLDCNESRMVSKTQASGSVSAKQEDTSYMDQDLISEQSLARLDAFRFKAAHSSTGPGRDNESDSDFVSSILPQTDMSEQDTVLDVQAWNSDMDAHINSDMTMPDVQHQEGSFRTMTTEPLGSHWAQLPSPLPTSPVKTLMVDSVGSGVVGEYRLGNAGHDSTPLAIPYSGPSAMRGYGSRGCGISDVPREDENRDAYQPDHFMEMLRQDVLLVDESLTANGNDCDTSSLKLPTQHRSMLLAQENDVEASIGSSPHGPAIPSQAEWCPATNELHQLTGETASVAVIRPHDDPWEVSSFNEVDDGLCDSDLIDAVTQECWDDGAEHLSDFDAMPDVSVRGNQNYNGAASSPLASPARAVPASSAIDVEDEDWMILDDEDHDLEAELIDLTDVASSGRAALKPSSGNRQNVKPAKTLFDSPVQDNPNRSSAHSNNDEVNGFRDHDRPKPIVRPPFPKLVRDRSPIIGLSPDDALRTCFRVGEALNAGCRAVRNNQSIFLELYARVISSYREPEGVKQHFVFADLFVDRPPHIHGVFEAWKGVGLWEYDSSRFLGEQAKGRMCRCIGKMKRESKEWKLVVFNIWEATWDDVQHVRGILCA